MKKSLGIFAVVLFLIVLYSAGVNALDCSVVSLGVINGPYSVNGQSYYLGEKHKENASYFVAYDQNCNTPSSSVAEKVLEVYIVDKSSSAINSINFNITTSDDFKKALEQMRDAILMTETGSNFARPTVQFVDDISPYIEKGAVVASNADVVIRWVDFKEASKRLQGAGLSYEGIKDYKDACGRFVASGFSVFLIGSLKGAKKLAPVFIQSFYGVKSTEKAKEIASNTENFMNNYPAAYQAAIAVGEGVSYLAASTASKFCYPIIDAPAEYYAKDMQLQLTTGKGIKETTSQTIAEIGEQGKNIFSWLIKLIRNLFGL